MNAAIHKMKQALALFLVFVMLFSEAQFLTVYADDSFTAVQDGQWVSWWMGRESEVTDTYRNAGVAYIHITSGPYAGMLAYCVQNRKSGPDGESYNGFNPWGTYYGSEWAEGARAILEYGYPNVSRPFGTTSDIEAYYATTQAFRFWVAEHDSAYSYYFSDLRDFSDEELRAYARTGEIPDKLYTTNSQGDRALIAAVELLIKARNFEGTKPEYSLSATNIDAQWSDTNGSGNIDSGDYFISYINVAMENAKRFVLDTTKLPLGTIITDNFGNTVTLEQGVTTTAFIGSGSSRLKIAIPYITPVEGAHTDNTVFSGINVFFTADGTRAQNNIVLAVPEDDADDRSVQRLVFLTNEEYVVGSKTFSVTTGDALPDDGNLTVHKQDSVSGEPIANVGFNLINPVTNQPVNASVKYTDSNGDVKFNYIGAGEYILEEVSIPEGYLTTDDTSISVTVVANKTTTITVENTPDTNNDSEFGVISIIKRDVSTAAVPRGSASLAGGIFGIYAAENINYIKDGVNKSFAANSLVETVYATSDIAASSDLPYGNYYVKELQAPIGYKVNNSNINVNLNAATVSATVTDSVIENKIIINKFMDSASVPEPNINFKITRVDVSYTESGAETIDSRHESVIITTDSNGRAETGFLPYGRYLVEQQNTTDGYDYVDPFIVFIRNESANYSYNLVDVSYKAKLKITKVDKTTGNTIVSDRACFTIHNNETNEFLTNVDGTQNFCTTNGIINIDNPLIAGTYIITEVEAPDGYHLSSNITTFKIDETTGSTDGTAEIALTIENAPIVGELTIHKYGEFFGDSSVVPVNPVYSLNGQVIIDEVTSLGTYYDYLTGATIVVKAVEDIYLPNGTKKFSEGETVNTFVTNGAPKYISNLALGKYSIEETIAPAGYVRDTTVYTIDLTTDNQTEEVVIKGHEIQNDLKPVSINVAKQIEKLDSSLTDVTAGMFAFGVYTNQSFTFNGNTVQKDVLVGIVENNKASQIKLPEGNFYLKEVGLTEAGHTSNQFKGITLNETAFNFTVDYDAAVNDTVTVSINNGNPIINKESSFDVNIYKVARGTTGDPSSWIKLGNAKLEIRNASNEVIFTGTTVDGDVLTVGLVPGTYTLTELEAPAGYLLNSVSQTFTVASDGIVTGVNYIINDPTSVTFTKVNAENEKLSGAKFEIYNAGNTLVATTDSTDSNGEVKVFGLVPGTYTFKEIVAPTGYVKSNTSYTFTINTDGTVSGTTTVINNKTGVSLMKTDEFGNPLEGAKFEVYGEDASGKFGNKVAEGITDSNGQLLLQNLLTGTYEFFEAQAPIGYIKDVNTYQFVVNDDGTVSGTTIITNNPTTVTLTKANIDATDYLSGAKFEVYADDGNGNYTVKVAEGTTDGNGKLVVRGLDVGTYEIVEVQAPDGYKLDNTRYQFTINANGTVVGTTNIMNYLDDFEVTVFKVDNLDNPLSGAKFTIYADDGSGNYNRIIASGTTDSNGEYKFSALAGTYDIVETEAPDGYIANSIVERITIDSNGNVTGNLKFVNNPTKVVLKKVDGDNNKLEGAKFEIYGDDNDSEGYNIKVFEGVTNVDGELVIIGLNTGTYEFVEVEAPTGYQLDDTRYQFAIANDGTVTGTTQIINYKSKVTLTKVNEDDDKLANAKFEVYADDGNGDFIVKVFEGVTNVEGELVITGLNAGTYEFIEVEAPTGYQLDNTRYQFVIDTNGAVTGTTRVINQKANFDVILTKVNDKNDKLANAKFEVYGKDINGNYTNKVAEGVTDINGEYKLNLPMGDYEFVEIQAPDGYILDNTRYQFAIADDGTITGTTQIINSQITVNINKVNADNDKLANAKFEVYADDGSGNYTVKVFEGTTNTNGVLEVIGLEPGYYEFVEVEAPTGYIRDNTRRAFVINNDGSVIGNTTVVNYEIPATNIDLKIIKVNNLDEKLVGAKFAIYKKDANGYFSVKVTDGITDINGELVVSLPEGEYEVVEISAPNGYIKDSNAQRINLSSTDDSLKFTNIQTKVVLTKVDDIGNKLEGAKFEIFGDNGATKVASGFTDANGELIVYGLPAGEYDFYESEAPDGYELDNGNYQFTIAIDGTVTGTTQIINYKNKTEVSIMKVNEENETLSGATFEIYADNGSGSYTTLIDEGTTDINGFYKIWLDAGTYEFVEIKAPNGYELDSTRHRFTVNSDGTITGNLKVVNKLSKISVDITKINQNNEKLAGAKFEVYSDDGSGNYNIKVSEGVTNSNGIFTIPDLDVGNYEFVEVEAPDSYILDNTRHSLVINVDGSVSGTLTVVNYQTQVNMFPVTLLKIDEDNNRLAGAEISIFGENNGSFTVDVANGTTNSNGEFTAVLAPGTYKFQEQVAPNGYVKDSSYYTFTIADDGTVTGTTRIVNSPITVTIEKVDENDNPLSGAKLAIYGYDNATGTYSAKIAEGVTDSNGEWTIEKIPVGEYQVRELEAPNGYILREGNLAGFQIFEDGTVTGSFIIRNEKTKLTITKTNSDGSLFLADAKFEIYGNDGNGNYTIKVAEGTTDVNGKLVVTGLKAGTYEIVEVQAPDGYELDSTRHQVTIDVYGVVTGTTTFTNDLTDSPNPPPNPPVNPVTADVEILKIDANTGLGLGGAKIRIWNNSTFNVEKITDSNGFIVLEDLVPETYYYQEIEAPQGYQLETQSYSFIIDEDGNLTGTTEFSNTPLEVVIHKSDITSSAPVPGAEITIYNADGTIYATNITDSNGDITLDKIPAGTYTFKETVAPDGYILNETVFTFTVSESGVITGDTNITNEKNQIIVFKTGANNQALEGVKFKLSDVNGDIGEYTTDLNGQIAFSGLKANYEYILTEVSTIDGYALLDAPIKFKVSSDGNVLGETDNTLNVSNNKTSVTLTKESNSGALLAGAKFNVKNETLGYNNDFVTNANGEINIEGLVPGTYKLKEVEAPTGYNLNSTEYEFTIDIYGNVSGTTTIVNSPIFVPAPSTPTPSKKADVEILKVNEDGAPLEGVKFVFYRNGNKLYTKTTDKDGIIELNDLRSGTYTYKEVETLDGYILSTTEYEFTVTNGKAKGDFKVVNYREETSVVLAKQDINTGAFLADTKLQVSDVNGNVLHVVTTNASGKAVIKNLKPGTYMLNEIAAPNGYALDPNTYTFKVDENYKVSGTTTVADDLVRINVYKTDADGKPLPNAKFGLFKEGSNSPAYESTTSTDGKLVFAGVTVGTYVLKETAAPNGYKLSEKEVVINVTNQWVNSSEAYTFINYKKDVTVEDEDVKQDDVEIKPTDSIPEKDTPKTDDNSPVLMFSTLIFVSTIGLAFCVVKLKKKEDE